MFLSEMATLDEFQKLLLANNSVIKSDITAAKDEVLTELKKEIEEAKTGILDSVNKTLETHLVKINNLEQKVESLEVKDRQRLEYELQKEVVDKKHNVIIHKIEENEPSTEALQNAIVKLLSETTGQTIELRDIDVMYRLGKKDQNKRRPILIRFISLLKRDLIMKNWKLFSDKNIDISEDFPDEIRKRRKELLPILKELKSKGMRASIRVDKLLVNGEFWSIERAKECIDLASAGSSEKEVPLNTKRGRSKSADSPPFKLNLPKKPQLKLDSSKPTGAAMKEFFQSTATPRSKSPIIVHTPHKNEQVTIINTS